MKFHINDEGRSMPCSAQISCKFGSEDGLGHYPTKEDAEKAYERHMAVSLSDSLSGKRRTQPKRSLSYDAPFPDEAQEQADLLRDRRDRNRDLSQMEMAKHMLYVEKTIDALVASGKTTENTHARKIDNGFIFSKERLSSHQEIVSEILEKTKDVPKEGKALFAGGLGGAGKSTVLNKHANIDQSQYATLNPDDIKEIMAEKGLIPKVQGLTPMESSPLVHEEASHITSVIFEKLRSEKKNIIFDITMSSVGSVQNRINHLKRSGYSKIDAIFVDIRPETSFDRGEFRYKEGLSNYLKNQEGHGGRFLPSHLTNNQIPDTDSFFKSKNAENLLQLEKRGGFTSAPRIFDNDTFGQDPKEVSFKNFKSGALTNSF